MIKVLLVEDHAILREGIRSLLENEDDISIVGEASNGAEALELVKKTDPDLILMDINMPVMNGIEAAKVIVKDFSRSKIMILSMLDHGNYVEKLMEIGVKGYALKNIGKPELIFAIKKVAAGGLYISSEINKSTLSDGSTIQKGGKKFTKREMEVLTLISEGMTSSEIAAKLFTSRRTVETHRTHLIEKIGVKNTAALIKYAVSNGLIGTD
jgi:DNA-binding NarL/FixJ family response regulator